MKIFSVLFEIIFRPISLSFQFPKTFGEGLKISGPLHKTLKEPTHISLRTKKQLKEITQRIYQGITHNYLFLEKTTKLHSFRYL